MLRGPTVSRLALKESTMPWLYLILAGLFEVAWAVGLRQAQGFTRLLPSLWVIVNMALSVWLLALATRHLPIGTAYAVWTGIGAFGTALLGMFLFGEPRQAARLVCLALIVLGIVGLRWTAAPAAA
jgi:quaternary ammonium compound-resistance protein SugE